MNIFFLINNDETQLFPDLEEAKTNSISVDKFISTEYITDVADLELINKKSEIDVVDLELINKIVDIITQYRIDEKNS